MKQFRAKLKEINGLLATYQKEWESLTPKETGERVKKIKDVRAEIQKILTEGAKDCEGGHRPLGLFHENTPNPFEIGDPVQSNRRSRGAFLEDVVEKWNADEWLPPRAPETIVATHKDKDGKVVSQKEVKLQK
jgi:hypothetical protein